MKRKNWRIDIRAALADPVKRQRLLDALMRGIKSIPRDGTKAVKP